MVDKNAPLPVGKSVHIRANLGYTVKKFKCSSALPNITYILRNIFSVFFLGQMCWLFIYAANYIFSKITIVKPGQI